MPKRDRPEQPPRGFTDAPPAAPVKDAVHEYLAAIGRRGGKIGGKVRSAAKAEAAKQNGCRAKQYDRRSGHTMTVRQEDEIQKLNQRTKQTLPISEYNGDVLTEIDGVTVKIGPSGGIEVPSLRSYLDPFEAAVDAGGRFRRQQERDDRNPERAATFTTGHLNPRWDPSSGRCVGSRTCPVCTPGA
jgi:hypothetical protein